MSQRNATSGGRPGVADCLQTGDVSDDLTTLHDELNALLDRLPDRGLGDDLKAHIAHKMRQALAVGDTSPLDLLTADDILTTAWPEPVWAVPSLLPAGLCILAGKPKVGKSWLALQVAQAVAAGSFVLGEQIVQGPILYLALEDPPRRLKERLQKQCWPPGLPAEFMPIGRFADQVGDLRSGGGERLARQIENRGYRLVVVDTLSRSSIGDQNDVQAMTQALTPIQEMAHRFNCAVLLVDHHSKLGSGDVITDILGSTAKGAMADTAWGLYRERGKTGAKLAVTGREVEEQTLNLSMDHVTGVWQYEKDAQAIQLGGRKREILDLLAEMGSAGVVDIAGLIDRDKGNVYKDLQELVNAGLVRKTGKGKNNVRYDLAGDDD